MRNRTATILFALGALTFSQIAQAVVPPPDGGYPGYNTAEGQNALFSRTTGLWNTALGGFALHSDTEGTGNTAVGFNGLRNNVTGEFNTAVGLNALYFNNGDPSIGRGSRNSAFGSLALFANTTGRDNCAFGIDALVQNSTGETNTATGAFAMSSNTAGTSNTAFGDVALAENTTGNYNTAIGVGALVHATGDRNTAVGSGAGDNIFSSSNVICIGQGVVGADVTNSCYIGNIWNQPGGAQAVYVDADGKLGALVSSARFKEDIKPMDKASETLLALKPVVFRYKKAIDRGGTPQFGLVAEEVEKVNPALVLRDKAGKPYSIRYDQVNAMLLNEFLKEHATVQKQQLMIAGLQSTADRQRKEMERLEAELKIQAAQIQKVNRQIEMSRSAASITFNKP